MTEDDARTHIAGLVSRETLDRLEVFHELLLKWQPHVNLVSNTTLTQAWSRHFLDSFQVFDHSDAIRGTWLDIGSGGGFPGLVCAILAMERAPDLSFHLIDSDVRKCTFLREVVRQTGLATSVHATRIEANPPMAAQVVSARALAPLPVLLPWVHRHMARDGTCLLQKGATYRDELESAARDWQMNLEILPSVTAPESVILRIRKLTHA